MSRAGPVRVAELLTPATTAIVKELLAVHSIADTYAKLKLRTEGQRVTWNQVKGLAGIVRADAERAAIAAAAAALSISQPTKPPKAPLTFEEQLARVAAGARLVPTFTYRRADPAYSLVGNATGML